MPTSRAEVRSALHMASDGLQEVEIVRSIRRSDRIAGYVVGAGRKWVLLAARHDLIILDGYVALRLDDITRVKPRGGPESFVGRALALRGQWPPEPAEVTLDSTADVIRTAAEAWPVVTLHFELDDPGICYVGRPVRYTTRSVKWRDISPQAVWYDELATHPLSRVTRVDFGGSYEAALAAVGGPPSG